MTPTNSMELMKRKRVKCLKRYKYGYFTQIRPLAAAVSCNQHLSSLRYHLQQSSTRMSLFAHLGASAADFTPYVPFGWRNKTNWRPHKFASSSTSSTSSAAAGAPAGAAAATAPNSYITYPSPPSTAQPLSRNQRRRRNKAARNSTPQPPPPPPPAPIYQPAAFPENYLPGYLEQWMNQYNPYLAPPPRRRAVSNDFNYDGDIERWLRVRGLGWTAPLA